jgi:hypothetical protein
MFSPISASNPHAVYAGNRAQPRDLTLKRAQALLNLLLDPPHRGLHKVEMIQQFTQQQSMMCGHPSLQGLLQLRNLVSQQPRDISASC